MFQAARANTRACHTHLAMRSKPFGDGAGQQGRRTLQRHLRRPRRGAAGGGGRTVASTLGAAATHAPWWSWAAPGPAAVAAARPPAPFPRRPANLRGLGGGEQARLAPGGAARGPCKHNCPKPRRGGAKAAWGERSRLNAVPPPCKGNHRLAGLVSRSPSLRWLLGREPLGSAPTPAPAPMLGPAGGLQQRGCAVWQLSATRGAPPLPQQRRRRRPAAAAEVRRCSRCFCACGVPPQPSGAPLPAWLSHQNLRHLNSALPSPAPGREQQRGRG